MKPYSLFPQAFQFENWNIKFSGCHRRPNKWGRRSCKNFDVLRGNWPENEQQLQLVSFLFLNYIILSYYWMKISVSPHKLLSRHWQNFLGICNFGFPKTIFMPIKNPFILHSLNISTKNPPDDIKILRLLSSWNILNISYIFTQFFLIIIHPCWCWCSIFIDNSDRQIISHESLFHKVQFSIIFHLPEIFFVKNKIHY